MSIKNCRLREKRVGNPVKNCNDSRNAKSFYVRSSLIATLLLPCHCLTIFSFFSKLLVVVGEFLFEFGTRVEKVFVMIILCWSLSTQSLERVSPQQETTGLFYSLTRSAVP